jgi:hypothetical protein
MGSILAVFNLCLFLHQRMQPDDPSDQHFSSCLSLEKFDQPQRDVEYVRKVAVHLGYGV